MVTLKMSLQLLQLLWVGAMEAEFRVTCVMYAIPGRYDIWLKRTSKRKVTAKPKLQTLPPTAEAFQENVKRAHLQACIWKSALSDDPPEMDPCTYG